jgi:hypothetical protein
MAIMFPSLSPPQPVKAVTPYPPPGSITWALSEHISSGYDDANGVAVDGSGVYVVGYDQNTSGNSQEWRVEKRSLTTGAIIWAVSEHVSSADDAAFGVAVDGSGVYVVGCDHKPLGNLEWRVEKRSLTTGAIIWAQSEDLSSGYDQAYGVAVDGSGVYVVGYDRSPRNYEWRVEKRSLTTGAIIWAQSERISSQDDEACGVAVDGSGVYVVGYDQNPGLDIDEWRVEKRSLTTGAIIWAQSEHISSSSDEAFGVAVDGSGVYVVGYDENPGLDIDEWRVERRSLTTGALIWFQSEHISSSYDAAFGVAVDGSGVYVVGADENTSGNYDEWRVERRSKPQGDLVSATGMGTLTFAVNNGSFLGLTAKSASSVSPLAPAGLTFPYGLFNFTVGNLTVGASVNVTATLPAPLPNGPLLMYWTFHNGVWRQLPASHFMVAANRTLFVMNLTDGVASDDKDETANRVIVDLGGVAYAYTVSLVAGWNLISLPVVPDDPVVVNMLRSLAGSGKLVSVWGYTGTPRTWKYYLPGKASTLTSLNDGYGYWVYMRSADTLYVSGTVIPPASNPPAYALLVGWDLVGFKSQPNATAPRTVGEFLLSIDGSYVSSDVWLYDNVGGVYVRADSSETLHPGDAMWVRMIAAATLYP